MNGTYNLGDYKTNSHSMLSVEGLVLNVAQTREYAAEGATPQNVSRQQERLRVTIDALTASIAADFPLPSEQTTVILREKLIGERVLYMRKEGLLESARSEGNRCRVQRLKVLSGPLAGETISDITFY